MQTRPPAGAAGLFSPKGVEASSPPQGRFLWRRAVPAASPGRRYSIRCAAAAARLGPYGWQPAAPRAPRNACDPRPAQRSVSASLPKRISAHCGPSCGESGRGGAGRGGWEWGSTTRRLAEQKGQPNPSISLSWSDPKTRPRPLLGRVPGYFLAARRGLSRPAGRGRGARHGGGSARAC